MNNIWLWLLPGAALVLIGIYIWRVKRSTVGAKQRFTVDGFHTTSIKYDILTGFAKRWKLRRFLNKLPRYPDNYDARGIVMCAGGLSYFTCAWVNIQILRRRGCDLPIEIWHKDGELTAEIKQKLRPLNVVCKNYSDYTTVRITQGYQLKPVSVLYSRFKEVLFLDADVVCLKDPTYLFDDPNYLSVGALFWPDFWITAASNPIWKIVNATSSAEPEQESGQMLIDKAKCWTELNVALHLNLDPYYYKILWGDKDTFRFAWITLRTSFHMIAVSVGGVGFKDEHLGFCGLAMLQHDCQGNHLFVHGNLLKWDARKTDQTMWQLVSKFQQDARKILAIRSHPVLKSYYLSIGGETTELPDESVARLEVESLQILNELRAENFYKEFIALMKRPKGNT